MYLIYAKDIYNYTTINFFAVDRDGATYVFENRPRINVDRWVGGDENTRVHSPAILDDIIYDFRDTLVNINDFNNIKDSDCEVYVEEVVKINESEVSLNFLTNRRNELAEAHTKLVCEYSDMEIRIRKSNELIIAMDKVIKELKG